MKNILINEVRELSGLAVIDEACKSSAIVSKKKKKKIMVKKTGKKKKCSAKVCGASADVSKKSKCSAKVCGASADVSKKEIRCSECKDAKGPCKSCKEKMFKKGWGKMERKMRKKGLIEKE